MTQYKGHISISRKLFESRFWLEERAFSRFEAWVDLIQTSRFEDGIIEIGYADIKLHRGESLISLRYLGERWKWSKGKVDKYLAFLVKDGMITKRTAKRTGHTIVKLNNYERYNDLENIIGTAKRTVEGQQKDRSRTNTNKDKIKRNKDKINIPPKSPKGDLDLSFCDLEFLPILTEWLNYKKDRGENYKSVSSLKALHTKLKNLSSGNVTTAREIIEQSMANNWKGLFELSKSKNHEENGTKIVQREPRF